MLQLLFLIVYFWKKNYCLLDNAIVIDTYINNTNHVHDKKVVITSHSTKLSNAKAFMKLQTTVWSAKARAKLLLTGSIYVAMFLKA
jgi:hypothetical protein